MDHLSQANLARFTGLSPMTVSRTLDTWGRVRGELQDIDRVVVLAVSELATHNMNLADAAALLAELSSEIRYLTQTEGNRCWITFVNKDGRVFHLTSLRAEHLAEVIAAFPFSPVLALHEIVGQAQERLGKLKAEKEAA